MPFTPAHAVVALPFAGSVRFSSAAIASGAVAPDLPLFLTGGTGYQQTHSLWAVPTLDLVLGAACLLLWWGLLRPGLLAVLPVAVRGRIGAPQRFPRRWLPVAVVAGAMTHVMWDAFTHRGRLGSLLLPSLADRVGPFALTSWAQYVSSAGGLLLLGIAAVVAYHRSSPSRDDEPSALGRAAGPVAIGTLLVPLAIAGVATASGAATEGDWSWSGAAFTTATTAIRAAAAALAVIGLFVRVQPRQELDRPG